jgi:hypothetical protein
MSNLRRAYQEVHVEFLCAVLVESNCWEDREEDERII